MARSGILLLDKPQGPTSHDLVGRARRALGTRKVGHAGTLDPMATGLMILGVESSTRLLTYLVGLDKEYLATIRLGVATDTDDAEGEVAARVDAGEVDAEQIGAAVESLRGDIQQVPSTFSAIKVAGRRSYDRARSGEAVELAARPVRVSEFEVLAQRRDATTIDLDIRVEVSSGTYVRALARDLGRALGVGGHLTALRRTRVGPFSVADAVSGEAPTPGSGDDWDAALLRPAAVAAALYPELALDAAASTDLAHGKRVRVDAPDAPVVAALTPEGALAGLVAIRGGALRILVNFPTSEVLP